MIFQACAGWTAAVCPYSMPLSLAGTREVGANMRCGIGSWEWCLSLADYVKAGSHPGSDRRRSTLMFPTLATFRPCLCLLLPFRLTGADDLV